MMQSNVIELCTSGDWMLGAEQLDGRLVESRLFLVTDLSSEKLPDFAAKIARINSSHSVGRGYEFQAFEEPCMGCEIAVKSGWELTSQAMKDEFLKRFIKALEQE